MNVYNIFIFFLVLFCSLFSNNHNIEIRARVFNLYIYILIRAESLKRIADEILGTYG